MPKHLGFSVIFYSNLFQIAITLGTLSVDYPSLFGLCALQLPLVSSLLNPMIYSIRWLPYRRAYHRALRWPCTKCCNRKFKKSSRSRSHNFNCKYAGWLIFYLSILERVNFVKCRDQKFITRLKRVLRAI